MPVRNLWYFNAQKGVYQNGFNKNCLSFQELKKNNVSTVVRVCEPSYKSDELESQGISVKDLAYDDGTPPPQIIVDNWFEVLRQK